MMKPIEKLIHNTYYTPKTETVSYYLADISKYKLISDDEIKKLIIKAKKGDKKSFNNIINSNQRFVFTLAKRFCNSDDNLLLDLINEANIGLMMSIDRFDINSDNKFLTYAIYWMQRQIFLYLSFTNPMIKVTNKVKTGKVSEIRNKFMMLNGRHPTEDEILDELSSKYGIIINNESDVYTVSTMSINNPMITENYDDFSSFYSDTKNQKNPDIDVSSNNSYDENTEYDYSKTLISNSIGVLTEKERKVVELLYGINYYREYEIQEVAEKLNMSKEGIRVINKRALDKLKNEITIKMGVV